MKNLIIIACVLLVLLACLANRDRRPPTVVAPEPPPEVASQEPSYYPLTNSPNWEPASGLKDSKTMEIEALQGTTFVALPDIPPPTDDEDIDEYLAKFSAAYDAWWVQEQAPQRVANRERIIELSK